MLFFPFIVNSINFFASQRLTCAYCYNMQIDMHYNSTSEYSLTQYYVAQGWDIKLFGVRFHVELLWDHEDE